jgi:hypothetical protein
LILETVFLLRSIALTTSFKSFFIRTISELSIATSFPDHILIAKSLFIIAIESFIPSQTIATLYHLLCISLIIFHLSFGNTSEYTFSDFIQTLLAIKFAEFLLSQVIIYTSIHISFRVFIASIDVSFTSSLTAIKANTLEVFHRNNTVFHSLTNSS